MGIDPNILTPAGWHAALAALEWQMDLGVSEITGEDPVDRYALPDTVRAAVAARPAAPVVVATDAVAVATAAAEGAATLEALEARAEALRAELLRPDARLRSNLHEVVIKDQVRRTFQRDLLPPEVLWSARYWKESRCQVVQVLELTDDGPSWPLHFGT